MVRQGGPSDDLALRGRHQAREDRGSDDLEAEDALIAALRVKIAHPAAAITYVRKQNVRGDRRHPHASLGGQDRSRRPPLRPSGQSRPGEARGSPPRRQSGGPGEPLPTTDASFRGKVGAPCRTPTCDHRLRRPVLYPAELRAPVSHGEGHRPIADEVLGRIPGRKPTPPTIYPTRVGLAAVPVQAGRNQRPRILGKTDDVAPVDPAGSGSAGRRTGGRRKKPAVVDPWGEADDVASDDPAESGPDAGERRRAAGSDDHLAAAKAFAADEPPTPSQALGRHSFSKSEAGRETDDLSADSSRHRPAAPATPDRRRGADATSQAAPPAADPTLAARHPGDDAAGEDAAVEAEHTAGSASGGGSAAGAAGCGEIEAGGPGPGEGRSRRVVRRREFGGGASRRGRKRTGDGPEGAADPALDGVADPHSVARTVLLDELTGQPRTRAELAGLLAEREIPEEVADEVLDRFVEVGLIDDAAFATAWVESRHRGRGLGKRALAQELRRRGVDDELARDALDELEPEQEEETARALVRRKLRSMRSLDREVAMRRLLGMLARKGYPGGLAMTVVKQELSASHEASPPRLLRPRTRLTPWDVSPAGADASALPAGLAPVSSARRTGTPPPVARAG